jgi:hypothetical protein
VTQPQNPMDGYQGCTCQEIGRSAPQEQFFEAAFRDVITHHTTRLQCCSAAWLQGDSALFGAQTLRCPLMGATEVGRKLKIGRASVHRILEAALEAATAK